MHDATTLTVQKLDEQELAQVLETHECLEAATHALAKHLFRHLQPKKLQSKSHTELLLGKISGLWQSKLSDGCQVGELSNYRPAGRNSVQVL